MMTLETISKKILKPLGILQRKHLTYTSILKRKREEENDVHI